MIEKLVLWGGTSDLNSLRHIWRHYHQTARKLGIESVLCADELSSIGHLTPGSTVIAADQWAQNISARPEVDYVLHNFNGDHPLCVALEPERLLRLQVWTNDAVGEEWAPYRRYSREGRILFQPWGTDLLAEEFMEPIFNATSSDVTFVGAIWSDQYQGTELGNEQVIGELRSAIAARGLTFRTLTHITDEQNVAAVRSARLAPAFAGGWQVSHNYMPCRVFKNVSYGVAAITNIPAFHDLFGSWNIKGDNMVETMNNALSLRSSDYVHLVTEQQRIVAHYTYRESIMALDRAIEAGR